MKPSVRPMAIPIIEERGVEFVFEEGEASWTLEGFSLSRERVLRRG